MIDLNFSISFKVKKVAMRKRQRLEIGLKLSRKSTTKRNQRRSGSIRKEQKVLKLRKLLITSRQNILQRVKRTQVIKGH